MIKRILQFLAPLAVTLVASTALASAAPLNLTGSLSQQAACQGIAQLDNTQGCQAGGGDKSINSIIGKVIDILSLIIGVAAAIMLIIAGLKFVFAGGDSNSVSEAKSTLIYALVGVAIAVFAQFLVHFAFNTANQAVNSTGSLTLPAGAVTRVELSAQSVI